MRGGYSRSGRKDQDAVNSLQKPTDLPDLAGVEHRFVDVGDVRLHVAEAGEGPPLLLLHGWPQNWWCWRDLIGPLARTHRVLVPDLRGFGWSDAPPGDYAKATLAADIVGLLDAEGIDRARVVGHDWGGYVAYLLALDHAERVERFVALDIPPPWPQRPNRGMAILPFFLTYQVALATPGFGAGLQRRVPGFVKTMLRRGAGTDFRWRDSDLDLYAAKLQEPDRARAMSHLYRTFLAKEFAASRKRHPDDLTVDGLLVWGEASLLHRMVRRGLEPGPRLRVESIPGAGHFLPEETPDAVLALVSEHLSSPQT